MFSDQALGCSKKRDTKYTNGIVTQQFIESVGWLGERSHSECDSTKTCDTSGSSQEASVDLSPLVKRSLAMMQADPLRTPPQAPPQPQYPASQMAQPSMVNPSMSQVGQPMHGAAPASNVVSELVLCMALKRSGLPLPVCSSIPDNYFSLLHLSLIHI